MRTPLLLIVCTLGRFLDAQTVDLSITSNPSGAAIEIGYVQVGHTPATIPLRAGTWKVTLRYAGMQAWQQGVEIRNGQPAKIKADLLPFPKAAERKPEKPLPVFSPTGMLSSRAPLVDAPRALPATPPQIDAPELQRICQKSIPVLR